MLWGFVFGDDLYGVDFWCVVDGIGGEGGVYEVVGVFVGGNFFFYLWNDVYDVWVVFDDYYFGYLNIVKLVDLVDVVVCEIDKYEVFGVFFFVG